MVHGDDADKAPAAEKPVCGFRVLLSTLKNVEGDTARWYKLAAVRNQKTLAPNSVPRSRSRYDCHCIPRAGTLDSHVPLELAPSLRIWWRRERWSATRMTRLHTGCSCSQRSRPGTKSRCGAGCLACSMADIRFVLRWVIGEIRNTAGLFFHPHDKTPRIALVPVWPRQM